MSYFFTFLSYKGFPLIVYNHQLNQLNTQNMLHIHIKNYSNYQNVWWLGHKLEVMCVRHMVHHMKCSDTCHCACVGNCGVWYPRTSRSPIYVIRWWIKKCELIWYTSWFVILTPYPHIYFVRSLYFNMVSKPVWCALLLGRERHHRDVREIPLEKFAWDFLVVVIVNVERDEMSLLL